ncbi:MAG: rhomboid family intramembrane serine protease [Rubripirellula sp.]
MASLSRFKFTLCASITLIVVAVASDSYWRPLPKAWREALGFAPTNLLDLQWHRLLTSLLLTAGEWKFLASALMLAFSLGIAEARFGTWQTVKLFFTSHLAVLVALSLLVLGVSVSLQTDWAIQLSESRDIGPSAGYYGCLGAILALLSKSARVPIFIGIETVLAARLMYSIGRLPEDPSVVSADIAHLVAFPLGMCLASWGFVHARPARPSGS